ncbi:MAG: hypothetical protein ACJA2S_000548 [Cyclobacteriaceae bacterium]|jgi:hypothetical protein
MGAIRMGKSVDGRNPLVKGFILLIELAGIAFDITSLFASRALLRLEFKSGCLYLKSPQALKGLRFQHDIFV